MNNKVFILVISLSWALTAHANPIVIEVSPIAGTGPLLLESLVIALGSRFIGLKTFRTMIFWCIVTHLTFFPAKWLFEITPEEGRLANLFLLEAAIVLIEALALRWWVKKQIGKTMLLYPLLLVFVGNLVSFILGLTPINTNYVEEFTYEIIKIGFGFTPQVLVALLAETLVISIILLKWKFDFIRFIYTWIFIALITYWGFIISYAMINDFGSLIGLNDKTFITVLEVVFTLVEAKIIFELSRYGFYRNQATPLSKWVVFPVAIIGNITSVIICRKWIFYN